MVLQILKFVKLRIVPSAVGIFGVFKDQFAMINNMCSESKPPVIHTLLNSGLEVRQDADCFGVAIRIERACEERGLEVEEEQGEECSRTHQIQNGGSPINGGYLLVRPHWRERERECDLVIGNDDVFCSDEHCRHSFPKI